MKVLAACLLGIALPVAGQLRIPGESSALHLNSVQKEASFTLFFRNEFEERDAAAWAWTSAVVRSPWSFNPWETSAEDRVFLDQGDILSGRLTALLADGGAEIIHPSFGALRLKGAKAVRFSQSKPLSGPSGEVAVVLIGGERLVGQVRGIGPAQIRVELGKGLALNVPLERIAGLEAAMGQGEAASVPSGAFLQPSAPATEAIRIAPALPALPGHDRVWSGTTRVIALREAFDLHRSSAFDVVETRRGDRLLGKIVGFESSGVSMRLEGVTGTLLIEFKSIVMARRAVEAELGEHPAPPCLISRAGTVISGRLGEPWRGENLIWIDRHEQRLAWPREALAALVFVDDRPASAEPPRAGSTEIETWSLGHAPAFEAAPLIPALPSFPASRPEADALDLVSGGRILGQVQSMDGQTLRIDTPYGILDLPRSAVRRLEFGGPSEAVFLGVAVEGESDLTVRRTIEGSPAFLAGIQPGDRLLRIDGQPIAHPEQLKMRLALYRPGEKIQVDYLRGASEHRAVILLQGAAAPPKAAHP